MQRFISEPALWHVNCFSFVGSISHCSTDKPLKDLLFAPIEYNIQMYEFYLLLIWLINDVTD